MEFITNSGHPKRQGGSYCHFFLNERNTRRSCEMFSKDEDGNEAIVKNYFSSFLTKVKPSKRFPNTTYPVRGFNHLYPPTHKESSNPPMIPPLRVPNLFTYNIGSPPPNVLLTSPSNNSSRDVSPSSRALKRTT